jgi:hypothetical protein
MPFPLDMHLYVLHRVLDGAPCSIEVAVKSDTITHSPPGHVRVFRDQLHDEAFLPNAERPLLAEATWTGSALTDRTGSLTRHAFDDVEAELRADLEERRRSGPGIREVKPRN